MQDSFKHQQRDFYFLWSQTNIIYSRWAEHLGVPYDTLITLYGLDIHGCMTQKSICDFYGFPKQTVSSLFPYIKVSICILKLNKSIFSSCIKRYIQFQDCLSFL